MKNFFKLGFVALAISMSVAACSSNKTTETTVDSDSIRAEEAKMDSMKMADEAAAAKIADSIKADSIAKAAKK